MKSLIWIIITLISILLASYTVISQEPTPFILKTFVVEGNRENTETGYENIQTFVIWQEPTGRTMLIETKKQSRHARERNIKYEQREEEIDKCIKKITNNWKRTYFKRSYEKVYDDEAQEWITTNIFWEKEREFYGYDEDEDFELKWRLKNRALNGEKIC